MALRSLWVSGKKAPPFLVSLARHKFVLLPVGGQRWTTCRFIMCRTSSALESKPSNTGLANSQRVAPDFSGRVTLPDGREYQGEFQKGIPHGQGITWAYALSPDGKRLISKYEGSHRNGKVCGQGKLYDGQGRLVYEGEWLEGKIEGVGRLVVWLSSESGAQDITASEEDLLRELQSWSSALKDGTEGQCAVVEGEFKENRVHGEATLWHKNPMEEEGVPIYTGAWRNGKEHGHGKRVYSDGSVYLGHWKCGAPSGQGELTSGVDGSKYIGSFERGMWHGAGVLQDRCGRIIYQGDWVNGEMEGSGKLYVYDDTSSSAVKLLEGSFKNGVAHGFATLKDSAGALMYSGPWVQGKRAQKGN